MSRPPQSPLLVPRYLSCGLTAPETQQFDAVVAALNVSAKAFVTTVVLDEIDRMVPDGSSTVDPNAIVNPGPTSRTSSDDASGSSGERRARTLPLDLGDDPQLMMRVKTIERSVGSLNRWFHSVVMGHVARLQQDSVALQAEKQRLHAAPLRSTPRAPIPPLQLPESHLFTKISEVGPFRLEEVASHQDRTLGKTLKVFERETRSASTGLVDRLCRTLWLRLAQLDSENLRIGQEPVHIPAFAAAAADAESSVLAMVSQRHTLGRNTQAGAVMRHMSLGLGVELGTSALVAEAVAAAKSPTTVGLEDIDNDFFGSLLADCNDAGMTPAIVGAILGLHLMRAAASHVDGARRHLAALEPNVSPEFWARFLNEGQRLPVYIATFQQTLQSIHQRLGLTDNQPLKLLEVVALFDPMATSRPAESTLIRKNMLRAGARGDWEKLRLAIVAEATKQPSLFPKNTAQRFARPLPEKSTAVSETLRDVNRPIFDLLAPMAAEDGGRNFDRAESSLRKCNVYLARGTSDVYLAIALERRSSTRDQKPKIVMLRCQLERRGSDVYAVPREKVLMPVYPSADTKHERRTAALVDQLVAKRLLAAGCFQISRSNPLPETLLARRAEISAVASEETGIGLPAIQTAKVLVADSLAG